MRAVARDEGGHLGADGARFSQVRVGEKHALKAPSVAGRSKRGEVRTLARPADVVADIGRRGAQEESAQMATKQRQANRGRRLLGESQVDRKRRHQRACLTLGMASRAVTRRCARSRIWSPFWGSSRDGLYAISRPGAWKSSSMMRRPSRA